MKVAILNGADKYFIQVFDYDNNESFQNRIATKLKTIPEWISPLPVLDKDKKNKEIETFTLITLNNDLIEYFNDEKNVLSFKHFAEKRDIRSREYRYPIEQIALYWTAYLLSVPRLRRRIPSNTDFFLLDLMKDVEEMGISFSDENQTLNKEGTEIFLKEFIDEGYKKMIKMVKEQIESIEKNSKRYTEEFNTLQEAKSQSHFPFQQEKNVVYLTTSLKRSEISMDTIFSYLVCSEYVPFFSFKNIYKMYYTGCHNDREEDRDEKDENEKDEKDDWEVSIPDIIYGHIYKGEILKDKSKENYSNVYLQFNRDEYLTIGIEISYENIPPNKFTTYQEQYINRMKDVCQHIPNIKEDDFIHKEERNVYGIAIFPKQSFQTFLLSDMIMNEFIFSHFMSVKEFDQPSKVKASAGLYAQFFVDSSKATCDMKSKISIREDPELRNIPRVDFPEGSKFVRLRIVNADTMKTVEKFLDIFSKLLTLYSDKKKQDVIIDYYKKLGCEIIIPMQKEKTDEQSELKLKDYEPDMFYPNYSRVCQHPPRVVDDKESKEIDDSSKMIFPRTAKEGRQHIYSCDHHDTFKYIGVHRNKNKDNRDRYPYLPCCYKKNQYEKGSNLNKYLQGITDKKEYVQQNILITDKFTNNKFLGELPENLDSLLTFLEEGNEVKKQYDYFRRGVRETRHSFLDCILVATGKSEQNLRDECLALADYPNLSAASQENWGKSVEEIRNELIEISKGEVYMNPRKWVRLCEVVFECKIIIFSRDYNSDKANIVLPSHCLNYLTHKNIYNTYVIIYEHHGSNDIIKNESRCELVIAKMKNPPQTEFLFFKSTRSRIEEFQREAFKQSYYHTFKREVSNIQSFQFDGKWMAMISGQYIDPYGKVRAIKLRNKYLLYTTPLPPFNVSSLSSLSSLSPSSSFDPLEFDFVEDSVSLNEGKVEEIHYRYKNRNDCIFTLKVDRDVKDVKDVKEVKEVKEKRISYPDPSKNHLETYFQKKRAAHVMIEYFIYFFSYYCHLHDIVLDNKNRLEILSEFMKRVVSKNQNIDYKLPSMPSISMAILQENGFIENKKEYMFVTDFPETRKRLLYSLRVRLLNHFQSVQNYYLQHEMEHFYDDKEQYLKKSLSGNTIIVENPSIVKDINNHISTRLRPDQSNQFLQNTSISEQPVLLISQPTRKDAKNLSYEWLETGRIVTKKNEEEDDKDKKDNLYLYQSANDVNVVGKLSANAETLVYRDQDEELHYMAVCRLTSS